MIRDQESGIQSKERDDQESRTKGIANDHPGLFGLFCYPGSYDDPDDHIVEMDIVMALSEE